MRKATIVLAFLLAVLTVLQVPKAAAATSTVNLTSDFISAKNYEYDIDEDLWDGEDLFKDTNGKSYTYGVGFDPDTYYDHRSMYVWYDISDYTKSTFEATVSLQKGWNTGDIGQTTIEIFADNTRIYKKLFVNSTAAANVKAAIPAGTKKIRIYSTIKDGSSGIQYAFIGNPRLTDALPKSAAKNDISIFQDLSPTQVNDDDDFATGQWDNTAFQLTDGTNASNAYGFEPDNYYNHQRMYASFFIGDYTHSTLEATVSLDKTTASGDRGQSEFVIYADNVKIYSKTFKNNTPQQDIKLALPKGTKYLTFYTLLKSGNQGNHAVILDNARLTRSLSSLPADDSVSVIDLGTSSVSDDDDVYHNKWSTDTFQLSEGQLAPVGLGLSADSYYSNQSIWSKYYIGDYTYPTVETKVSLDARWKTGDRGTTTVYIQADDKIIYQTTLNNLSGSKNLIVPIPRGTTYLTFGSNNPKGANGHGVIFEDPRLTKRPLVPTVSGKVYETSTVVKGTGQAKATAQVKVSGKVIGKAAVATNGTYAVTIPKQKVGTKLEISVVDAYNRVSPSVFVTVEKDPTTVLKGWVQKSGKWYYYTDKGVMYKGWLKYYGKSYYFGTDGVMKTGWFDLSGKRYYLNPTTGAAETGWTMISGKWYFFATDGHLVIDTIKPTIYGVTAKTIKINSTFNSRTGVTAKDNVDGDITSLIQVSGTVNTKTKGTYTLTYSVTDKSGNKAVVTRKITVQ